MRKLLHATPDVIEKPGRVAASEQTKYARVFWQAGTSASIGFGKRDARHI
jgi:hypothetical protein